MEIKRDVYLNKLIRKKKNELIKIVTGVRRCGKSYLLFNLFRNRLLDSGVADDHNIKVRRDENGIITIGLRNFLLDENSLKL